MCRPGLKQKQKKKTWYILGERDSEPLTSSVSSTNESAKSYPKPRSIRSYTQEKKSIKRHKQITNIILTDSCKTLFLFFGPGPYKTETRKCKVSAIIIVALIIIIVLHISPPISLQWQPTPHPLQA